MSFREQAVPNQEAHFHVRGLLRSHQYNEFLILLFHPYCSRESAVLALRWSRAPVQDLPKGALLVVAGHDALGNPAVLDETDLEVTFNPPEAVHEATIKVLPDSTVVICGLVQHEAEAFVSVLGSKVRPPLPPLQHTTHLQAGVVLVGVLPIRVSSRGLWGCLCAVSGTIVDVSGVPVAPVPAFLLCDLNDSWMDGWMSIAVCVSASAQALNAGSRGGCHIDARSSP